MKFVIDYGDTDPEQSTVNKYESNLELIKDRLSSIMDEIINSPGIFILKINGEYEIKQAPFSLCHKIDRLLSSNMFPGFTS